MPATTTFSYGQRPLENAPTYLNCCMILTTQADARYSFRSFVAPVAAPEAMASWISWSE